MRSKLSNLFVIVAIISPLILSGCSAETRSTPECVPPSSETTKAKLAGLEMAVKDLECLTIAEYASLQCEVLNGISFEEIADLVSLSEILSEIKTPKEAKRILEDGLPKVLTLKRWIAPFHEQRDLVLRELNLKAQANNYRAYQWEKDFERSIIAHCELGKEFSVAITAFDTLAEQRKRVATLAASAWVPDGFTEAEGGVAFRELNEKRCGWGDCLHYEIVARDSCAELGATLWIYSKQNRVLPLDIISSGKRNVKAGDKVSIQLQTSYDLTQARYNVDFVCN